MNDQYRVTFEVDGDCSWPIEASSPDEARDLGIARFRAERFWAQRYPVTPPCTVERISGPEGGAHGDIGPFR